MGAGEMAELPPFQELGNLLHGGVLGRFRHVIDQHEPNGDVASLKLQRDRWLGRDARRIQGEDAIVAENLATDREVPREIYLDNVVHALSMGDVSETVHGVFSPVVDGGVSTGSQGDLRLLI